MVSIHFNLLLPVQLDLGRSSMGCSKKPRDNIRGPAGSEGSCLGFCSNTRCIQSRHWRSESDPLACVDKSIHSTPYKKGPVEVPWRLRVRHARSTAQVPVSRQDDPTELFIDPPLSSSGNFLMSCLFSNCVLCLVNVEL